MLCVALNICYTVWGLFISQAKEEELCQFGNFFCIDLLDQLIQSYFNVLMACFSDYKFRSSRDT